MSIRQRLVKECDRMWQELVRLRADSRCEKCGSTDGCSGHHINKRRFLHTRWLINNGIYLCFKCHRHAEEHPKEFMEYLKKEFKQRSNGYYSWNYSLMIFELKELRDGMKDILKEIQNGNKRSIARSINNMA